VQKYKSFLNTYFNDFRWLEWGEDLALQKTIRQGQRMILKIVQENQTKWQWSNWPKKIGDNPVQAGKILSP